MAGGLTNLLSQGLSYGRGLTTLPYVAEPDSIALAGAGALTVAAGLGLQISAIFAGAGGLSTSTTLALAARASFPGSGSLSATGS